VGSAEREARVGADRVLDRPVSTAEGESTSDFLVHRLPPVTAVLLGGAGLVVSLIAVACIVAMQTLSTNIQGTFDYIGNKLNGLKK